MISDVENGEDICFSPSRSTPEGGYVGICLISTRCGTTLFLRLQCFSPCEAPCKGLAEHPRRGQAGICLIPTSILTILALAVSACFSPCEAPCKGLAEHPRRGLMGICLISTHLNGFLKRKLSHMFQSPYGDLFNFYCVICGGVIPKGKEVSVPLWGFV